MKDKYDVFIEVRDGEVADELNGATFVGVYSIGINCSDYLIDCFDENNHLIGFFCYARNKNSWIHCDYDDWNKEINLVYKGEIDEEVWEYKNQQRIKEIKKIIKNFADQDQYSANNEYVKALYRQLRELEGREQIKEEHYEPQFIDGSDVPINGYYE